MRSATAGGESLTRRPSSAIRSLASAWSSSTISRSTSSSGSKLSRPRFDRFDGDSPLYAIARPFSNRVWPSYCAPMRGPPQGAEARDSLDPTPSKKLQRLPPQGFFLVSAVFHYLGPSFAVLLFA